MAHFHNNALIGASGQGGYQIERSLRFNSADSAYLVNSSTRTAAAGAYTFSFWIKRCALGNAETVWSSEDGSGLSVKWALAGFGPDNIFYWWHYSNADANAAQSNGVLRDPSAWYHIVLSKPASAAGTLYINGVAQTKQTSFTADADAFANAKYIGRRYDGTRYSNCYLTEFYGIDGQALTPSSFGETDTITGVWKPKKYAGTYGTNGFYLNFKDNSSVAASTLGKDYSGNGNNWTPSATFSVTPGVGNDSMIDTPTPYADGGNGRGNYCTFNPLLASAFFGGATLKNGNLQVQGIGGVANTYARGTMAILGKAYAEFYFDVVSSYASVGVVPINDTAANGSLYTQSTNVSYRSGGNKRVLGTESAYGASWVASDIIGVAVDPTANTIEFFKNGTSQGVITSSSFFAQGNCTFAVATDDVGSPQGYANFGQRSFSYTPPAGFLALNTQNLPEPSIKKPSSYMDVVTWSGTGGGSGATRSLTGLGFSPDLVWGKIRTSSSPGHILMDAVRGVGTGKYLQSNTINAEGTSGPNEALYGYLSSLDSAGFTVTNGTSTFDNWNKSGDTYVAWCWDESATPGFDIVTYTGQTGDNIPRNISHNLGVTPNFIIIKNRNWSPSGDAWFVYHSSIPSITTDVLCLSRALYLDSTGAASGNDFKDLMNNTLPTSTVFTTMSPTGISAPNRYRVNGRTDGYVAYLWSEVAGFSKFGSYVSNGSSDGPFVYCGFRPRWILVKATSNIGAEWILWDTARTTYNLSGTVLSPTTAGADSVDPTYRGIDIVSNGFKIRCGAGNNPVNNSYSNDTYIFAAFAESPFKYSLAR